MSKTIMYSIILMLCYYSISSAQIAKNSELFLTLKKQDSIFFERGFNQCDYDYLDKIIHEDHIFYHDQSGVEGKEEFLISTKKYICADPDKKPIRKLEEGSLEVFPLYNNGVLYAAIQRGVHNFYIREANKQDRHTSSARFTHVYVLNNNQWQIKEVLSYDHSNTFIKEEHITFEEEMLTLLKQHKVPALGLGIIKNGQIQKIQVLGHLKEGTVAPYNTIFKVASLTKPVFSLTVLKLIDSGLLSMDEPLYKYWIDPEIKNDKRYKKLTPKIILSHQSGFPNWRYLKASKKLAFEFEPGTKFQYSGEGFEYLRKAIEIKFNKPIEELADSLIFKPAKMSDTHFWWDKTIDEDRYAKNHDKEGNPFETHKYYEANAAANLLTTVEDYCNFLTYVLNGADLSHGVFQEMITSQVKLKENDYFGLGWEKLTNFSTGEYILLHSGKDPGVNTLAVISPETKNGYVIFLNGDNGLKIYEKLMQKYLYLGNELWTRG